jgi:hypothetical protein
VGRDQWLYSCSLRSWGGVRSVWYALPAAAFLFYDAGLRVCDFCAKCFLRGVCEG